MENSSTSSPIKMEANNTQLKKHLALHNVVAMMICITGHVAIFMTPGIILRLSGSILISFILWFIGGFFVYTLALCFVELSTLFQKSGGPYLFISLTFGPLPGFLIGWGYVILISGPFLAWASYTASIYMVRAITNDSDCESNYHQTSLILAGLLTVLIMYLNCRHLKFLMKVQSALTAAKMFMIACIIIAGVYVWCTNPNETFDEPFQGSTSNPGDIALALLVVTFSNGGWQAVLALLDEVKNPARTIPLAIQLTFAFNVGINFVVFLSYVVVVGTEDMKNINTIALLFWQRVWPPFIPVVSASIGLAVIGAANTAMMGHSRVVLAMSHNGILPNLFGTLSPMHSTPMVALFTITSYSLLMLSLGDAVKMIQFIGLFSYIMGFSIASAVLYLRLTKPSLHRPYKVPVVFPCMQMFVTSTMIVLVIYQDPPFMLLGITIFLSGIPFYVIAKLPKPKFLVDITGNVTAFIQKCFIQVPWE